MIYRHKWRGYVMLSTMCWVNPWTGKDVRGKKILLFHRHISADNSVKWLFSLQGFFKSEMNYHLGKGKHSTLCKKRNKNHRAQVK